MTHHEPCVGGLYRRPNKGQKEGPTPWYCPIICGKSHDRKCFAEAAKRCNLCPTCVEAIVATKYSKIPPFYDDTEEELESKRPKPFDDFHCDCDKIHPTDLLELSQIMDSCKEQWSCGETAINHTTSTCSCHREHKTLIQLGEWLEQPATTRALRKSDTRVCTQYLKGECTGCELSHRAGDIMRALKQTKICRNICRSHIWALLEFRDSSIRREGPWERNNLRDTLLRIIRESRTQMSVSVWDPEPRPITIHNIRGEVVATFERKGGLIGGWVEASGTFIDFIRSDVRRCIPLQEYSEGSVLNLDISSWEKFKTLQGVSVKFRPSPLGRGFWDMLQAKTGLVG